MMLSRSVGHSDVTISAVGLGTCQLRLVPEEVARATLRRGFESGIDWVHTSPDYCGADELLAQVIAQFFRETGKRVIAASDASGEMSHFEYLFERACRLFGTRRMPMFGISCIDDQEFVGHNVWGSGGMVEFVLRKRREGRIGAVFATTHGPPEYVRRLITCGAFDAIMLAYNPLGFHVLSSYAAAEGKCYEDIPANRERIFGLARERGVSVLAMKALAGGLLGKSKALPPHHPLAREREVLRARDVLRYILRQDGVTAVVPGAACPAEAEEDALAGHGPLEVSVESDLRLERDVASLRTSLCSRCGECERTCSQGLPISWLFRDAYIWLNPSDTFDAVGRLGYFHLHPEQALVCGSCPDPTCSCPAGLHIPSELALVHEGMVELREQGLLARTPEELRDAALVSSSGVRVLYAETPRRMDPGETGLCRFWLENSGERAWGKTGEGAARVQVRAGSIDLASVALREDVAPNARTHVTFSLRAPQSEGAHALEFQLAHAADATLESFHHAALEVGSATIPEDPRRSNHVQMNPIEPATLPRATHGVRHVSHNLPEEVLPGSVFLVRLVLENTGSLTWSASRPGGDHVGLAVHWDERVVANHTLPRPEVKPDSRVTLHFAVEAPLEPGVHTLALKLVQYQVAVFEDRGAPALVARITVLDRPPDRGARLWAAAQRVDPWHYLPTRGISRGASGASYPVFAEKAQGCHLWDLSGKQYIDYTMGWGTVLLGYAHPKVSEAVGAMLGTGSVLAWPQAVEIEVAEMLCEDFPSAEMACFGKNGSDACTFAARMARVFTGKRTILFSGYHGWQDFWTEQVGFERTGVPVRDPALIHRFPFHDLGEFRRLYEAHKHDLAAVMVEPSPWAGNGLGFEPDTDAEFLREISAATKRAGALFILDEIVTGYRYPGHSVQKAKDVVPDLTCLGKAIASGLPLSAVVGRADVFKSALPRTFFAATFHSEAYSFAAARAAIGVYRSEPVAKHVWDYGEKLRAGVHEECKQLGVEARMWGAPFRMNFRFGEQDPLVLQLRRTLFQQELLKAGITTYNGVMLPCYAHDELALARTLIAFGEALDVVARTAKRGNWDEAIEIPLLIDL